MLLYLTLLFLKGYFVLTCLICFVYGIVFSGLMLLPRISPKMKYVLQTDHEAVVREQNDGEIPSEVELLSITARLCSTQVNNYNLSYACLHDDKTRSVIELYNTVHDMFNKQSLLRASMEFYFTCFFTPISSFIGHNKHDCWGTCIKVDNASNSVVNSENNRIVADIEKKTE